MTAERYVVLGLARVRADWPTDVARWATGGSLPVEFVQCVSAAEVRVRASQGRPHSAALMDHDLPALDRDLVAVLAEAGIPTVLIGEGRDDARRHIGAVAAAPPPASPGELLELLAAHAAPVRDVDEPGHEPDEADGPPRWRGRLVAVTGQPGAGRSTIACAIAQHLATDPRLAGDVVLADLAHRAHLAILHDAGDVIPGLQELVEAHRTASPDAGALRSLQFAAPTRGYRVLLGLRRPQDWLTIRARAFDAALDNLLARTRLVVADVDADVEGEQESGSLDIEDRNLLARRTLRIADLVAVVTAPTITGLHGLSGTMRDLDRLGVERRRLLIVVNRSPRGPRARAELTRAIAGIARMGAGPSSPVGPIHVPARHGVDQAHRDVASLPASVVRPVGRATTTRLDQVDAPSRAPSEPVLVVPGSLGTAPGPRAAS